MGIYPRHTGNGHSHKANATVFMREGMIGYNPRQDTYDERVSVWVEDPQHPGFIICRACHAAKPQFGRHQKKTEKANTRQPTQDSQLSQLSFMS